MGIVSCLKKTKLFHLWLLDGLVNLNSYILGHIAHKPDMGLVMKEKPQIITCGGSMTAGSLGKNVFLATVLLGFSILRNESSFLILASCIIQSYVGLK